MVEMIFSPEMKELLGRMRGKVFKSYEGDIRKEWNVTGYPLRVNLGSFAVDISCAEKEVDGWRDLFEYDPPTCLTCVEASLDSSFLADHHRTVHAYLVNERITGVEVINDVIEVDGIAEATVDTALVIRTKDKVYTFSRAIWFSDLIDVNVSSDVVIPYTVEQCEGDWSDDPEEGEAVAKVTRTTVKLA